ncbi:sensor domain-containing protein [Mycolicibacterium litorale]|nr:sensor domain-containing protein [Mycolicibacterium litorale]MCV7414363.1 sensor domain-containing protein [Mycolicibacterium litorale]
MRQSRARVVVAAACLLVTGCTQTVSASSTTTTRTMIPRPLVERELPGLLLEPEEVNATMGTTGMAVVGTEAAMPDNSALVSPPECLAIDAAAEAPVYAGSEYWAERGVSMNNGDDFTHYLKQAVVLFPYQEKAAAFFDMSVNQWPACRQFTHTQSGYVYDVGQTVNEDHILSTTAMMQEARAPGWGCGRALALRNNIIIDVNTCSAAPADSAVKIAAQIGENVQAQW